MMMIIIIHSRFKLTSGTEKKAAETAGSKKAGTVTDKFELKHARSLTLSVHLQGVHLDVSLFAIASHAPNTLF